MARKQINIRIDEALDAAIDAKAEEIGITKTDLIIKGIKLALGMPADEVSATAVLPDQLDERIASQIADLEQKLAARIAEVEKKLAA